jgi:hypothetical protein
MSMSSEYTEAQAAAKYGDQDVPRASGWVGWIAFAGMIMALLGTFHIIQGLVALLKDDYFVVGSSGLAISASYTQWGWTHLIVGAIVLAAGIGVFTGKMWARVVGVLLAYISAILNFCFIGAHPLWSIMMIAMCFVVILALTVHGSEVKN